MSKNIFIGVLIVVAGILLYFLLHEPKQTDNHKTEYDRVVADNKSFKEHEAERLKIIDSLESVAKAKDSVIADLKAEKKATQKEADKYAATANRLAGEVKDLRRGDTSEFAYKCDSLAEAAQNFAYQYQRYKDYSDSLLVQMEQQGAEYIAMKNETKSLYDELKVKYDALMQAYTDLFKDYTNAKKTVKRERLKTKIAALLALIGGAAAVLK